MRPEEFEGKSPGDGSFLVKVVTMQKQRRCFTEAGNHDGLQFLMQEEGQSVALQALLCGGKVASSAGEDLLVHNQGKVQVNSSQSKSINQQSTGDLLI